MSTIKTPRKKHLELLLTNFTLLCSYNRKDTKAVINKTIFVKIKAVSVKQYYIIIFLAINYITVNKDLHSFHKKLKNPLKT